MLTLPYAALQYRYGVNRVFVVDGDQLAVAKELKVGERLGDASRSSAASTPANRWR